MIKKNVYTVLSVIKTILHTYIYIYFFNENTVPHFDIYYLYFGNLNNFFKEKCVLFNYLIESLYNLCTLDSFIY